jgi:hypothetical protein
MDPNWKPITLTATEWGASNLFYNKNLLYVGRNFSLTLSLDEKKKQKAPSIQICYEEEQNRLEII